MTCNISLSLLRENIIFNLGEVEMRKNFCEEPYDLELKFTGAKGTHKWVRIIAHTEQVQGKTIRV